MRQLQEYSEQLREQSNTLQGLRKDEESLRGALANLKSRMQQGQQAKQNSMQAQNTTGADRAELLEKAREQERALERELTKVRELLANNSKVNIALCHGMNKTYISSCFLKYNN